ncbi:concanavalin A-like lectin/glucanase domain-containing protein [Thermothelomyces heterothallicus CBS 202.75]|uniref:concanavalin A-like lectin/glucanase domain-containing protein n=1 Tax=Thermothelomyces heterothallicus CBS 202.75 TaxID=1149848 RepID=UPI003742E3D4
MFRSSKFTFTNLVIRGFNPGPTVYVVPAPATSTAPAPYFLSTSTSEFFPGAAIYHSTDLINWTLIGHALNRRGTGKCTCPRRCAWRAAPARRGLRLEDFAIHVSEIDLPTGRTRTPPGMIRASPFGVAEGLAHHPPGQWTEAQPGRETFLVKVGWVDDWSVFNEGKNVTLETVGRERVMQARAAGPDGVRWRADLSRPDLELGWYHKNTPIKKCYSLTERPGHLGLYGNCYDLTSPESPALLLRKRARYNETFRVKMSFKPGRLGYESGVTLWWHQYSFASIGVGLVEPSEGAQAV